MPEPVELLENATVRVPAVKYAFGVVGVAAASAIATQLIAGDPENVARALLFMLAAMVLLFTFARLAQTSTHATRHAAQFLLWSVLVLVLCSATLMLTQYFIGWPRKIPFLPNQSIWIHSETSRAPGCSDGTREGFADDRSYPTIAGCAAKWESGWLGAPATGQACGNDAGICVRPADACAPGWHVCGFERGADDLRERVTADQCAGISGAFLAALGDVECSCPKGGGSGPVCCGSMCVNQHGDCVWPNRTSWFGGLGGPVPVCGNVTQDRPYAGVLCCKRI